MARFQRCAVGMEIQSVLFPRESFSVSKAKTWAKRHGFTMKKVDETENFYRFRQRPPNQFKPGSFRIITLGNSGVKAIIACPKERDIFTLNGLRQIQRDNRDRREVHEAIKDFRNVPRSGRGRERALRIKRAIR